MDKRDIHKTFKKACDIVGGQKKMADLLDVSAPTVNQWLYRVRPIPAEQCPEIEKLVNGRVKCEKLLPNVDWSYLRLTVANLELAQQKNHEKVA